MLETIAAAYSGFIGSISNYLYTYILIVLLVAGGIYFTVRTKFVQFRFLPESIRIVMQPSEDQNSISAFKTLMVSTASRVGTGNIAGISTAICLVLAYPLAYIMARAKPRTQKVFLTIIMIPMWMNFLIRTYAWMTILQDTGIFNNFLTLLHLPNIHIIGTEAAVIIGMVYDYIPYMILPLYSIMAKMDERLIEAARDLGCNSFGVLRRVIWPLSLPGVISGITMVLIPSVSTFYISQKLGDGKIMLIGDVIEGQYVANNLHFAAAIAFVLMILLLVCMAVMRKLAGRRVEGGL